jgi:hypothetical protein
MIDHELQLWEYSAKELDLGEHRYVERHLEDCPECVEQLAAVEVARRALALAKESSPRVDWARADERIGALVERRLAAQARGPWLARLGLGGLGLAAVAAGLALWVGQAPVAAPPQELPRPGAPVAAWARVDSADGLTRVGDGVVAGGTELRTGDVLRTTLAGRAFVHLPDESHVRVAGGSQVAMTRTERDDIALTLERGRVAVRASHLERQGFVVHAGGLAVHVVGTTFTVAREVDGVEVAVKEGQVRVELSTGDAVLVSPGERLRVDARTERTRRLKLTASLERELAEVADLADTTASVEQRAVVPAAGGAAPSQPPLVAAQGTPRTLPRLSPAESKARLGVLPAGLEPGAPAVHEPSRLEAPVRAGAPGSAQPQVESPAVSPESRGPVTRVDGQPNVQPQGETPAPAAPAAAETRATPTIVLEAPEDVWPSLGGGEVIRGVPPKREPAAASRPEEWASPPPPAADEWATLPPGSVALAVEAPVEQRAEAAPRAVAPATPQDPATSPARLAPKDLETLFLQRAEVAVEQGSCERHLLGLEDLAQDPQRSARSEQARVLRARCFDRQLRPRQAMNEYRKYLEEYPSGRFVSEAQQALGE